MNTQNYCWLCYHLIIRTRNHKKLIKPPAEREIYEFIKNKFRDLKCEVLAIKGHLDHIHVLFQQGPQTPSSEIIKKIKGSSSRWINKNELTEERFQWQTGFKLFTVGHSGVQPLQRYIADQEEHHRNRSTDEEILAWEAFYEESEEE